MERVPGVLLYKLTQFDSLCLVLVMELLSTGVLAKLISNRGSFVRYLRKLHRNIEQDVTYDDLKLLVF
jgi:hypothetical protein